MAELPLRRNTVSWRESGAITEKGDRGWKSAYEREEQKGGVVSVTYKDILMEVVSLDLDQGT